MPSRLLLWDIDGTLVRAGPLGGEVFDMAVADVVGKAPATRVRMSGKTDPLIITEQLSLLGMEIDESVVAAVCLRLAERLKEVAPRLPEQGRACPGATEVLTALGRDAAVVCGVVTGNLRPNAEVKLAAFGLDTSVDFECGAYGSDATDRDALVPIAMRRAAAVHGAPFAREGTWVIGDTPRDLGCARAGGVRCLLVATGGYSYEDLYPLGADALIEDLTDTESVIKILTAS